MTPEMTEYVMSLRNSLPADSRWELLRKMKADLGFTINICTVDTTLYFVRRHAVELGWTVPHAKRGCATANESGRFFRLPAQAAARFALNEERRRRHDEGLTSTILTFTTQAANLQTQLTMLTEHETLRVHKQYAEHLGDMMESLSRGLRRMQKIVAEKAAASA